MRFFNDPVFYVPGSAWIIDEAELVGGVYRSFFQGHTLEQVAERNPGVQIVELEDAVAQTREAARRPVTAITEADFDEALKCLPPNQWHRDVSTESFKSSEHFSGPITRIYARIGDQHFQLRDNCAISHAAIIERCRQFTTEGEPA